MKELLKELWKKLKSRKLWMAVAGVATGIAVSFGADAGEISKISGAVLSVISVVTYIAVEGKIDAEGVKNAIVAIEEAVEVFEEDGD